MEADLEVLRAELQGRFQRAIAFQINLDMPGAFSKQEFLTTRSCRQIRG